MPIVSTEIVGGNTSPPLRLSVPPSRLSVRPHRDLGISPSRFERWLMREKDLQTKFRGNSDEEEKTLQSSAKTFFLEITCFWLEKNLKFLISARKSL